MPQFNFHALFAEDVEAGRKTQTVRAERKHAPRVGETAHCFTGLRTAAARVLGRFPIVAVRPIFIDLDRTVTITETGDPNAVYHRRPLAGDELEAFARADGFETAAEFLGWIEETHRLPFEGTVTYWQFVEGTS